ncbi:hypothetical protein D3C81_1113620 [compost metagenome]
MYAWYIYTLLALNGSAVNNAAFDLSTLNVYNGKADQTIIDQNSGPYFNVIWKLTVSY